MGSIEVANNDKTFTLLLHFELMGRNAIANHKTHSAFSKVSKIFYKRNPLFSGAIDITVTSTQRGGVVPSKLRFEAIATAQS